MSFHPSDDHVRFEDILALVRFLRSPEGCAWDRAQTHRSVRRNLLEETYEVAEGIDRDDPAILREELGDYLFQAAFHIVLEEEQGRLSAADIIQDVCTKMIRRHPHLFTEEKAQLAAAEVPGRWEELKKQEKGQSTQSAVLAAIPKTLPALMYAQKLTEKAARAGFTYESAEAAKSKLQEEWRELCDAADQAARKEEFGDLLLAFVNYGRLLGIDAEEALSYSAQKFLCRFTKMEKNLEEKGMALASCTKNELQSAWFEQKNTEKSTKIAKI